MAITEGRLTATEVASIGLVAEGAVGVAVIALAIIGIGKVDADQMVAIATIIFGVALMMQGMEAAAEASMGEGEGGGVMADVLAGLAGVVLGILAFVGNFGAAVEPAAIIVFGGALLLGGVARSMARRFAGEASMSAASAQILIGFAAAVLGILAYLIPAHWQLLTLVALLSLGASLVISGAAIGLAQAIGGGPVQRTIVRSETSRTTFPSE